MNEIDDPLNCSNFVLYKELWLLLLSPLIFHIFIDISIRFNWWFVLNPFECQSNWLKQLKSKGTEFSHKYRRTVHLFCVSFLWICNGLGACKRVPLPKIWRLSFVYYKVNLGHFQSISSIKIVQLFVLEQLTIILKILKTKNRKREANKSRIKHRQNLIGENRTEKAPWLANKNYE